MINELYHITSLKYFTSILTEGLKINSNKRGFVYKHYHKYYYKKYSMQPIFLTKNPIYIYKTQLTEFFVKKNCSLILKVNVEGIEFEDEYDYLRNIDSSHAKLSELFGRDYISKTNINPNRIKFYSKL